MLHTKDADSSVDNVSLESSFTRIQDIDKYIQMYENDIVSYARRLKNLKIKHDEVVQKVSNAVIQFNVDHPDDQYDLSVDSRTLFKQHLVIRAKYIRRVFGIDDITKEYILDGYFWELNALNETIALIEKNMKNVTYVLRITKEDHEIERMLELVDLEKKVAKFNAEHPDNQLDASLQVPTMYKQYLFLLSKFASQTGAFA